MRNNLPSLGFGLGLRTEHYNEILDFKPAGSLKVDWFEALSENYLIPGGLPLNFLERIRADYPVVMHGVSLSIGSTTAIDQTYLKDLKNVMLTIDSFFGNEHNEITKMEIKKIKVDIQLLILRNEKYKELVQKSAELKPQSENILSNFV